MLLYGCRLTFEPFFVYTKSGILVLMNTLLRLSLLALLLGPFSQLFSQTTVGPNNPSAAADGGGGSGGTPNWSIASGTPYSSDNTYASIVSMNKSKNTNYLELSGFGFAVPAGSYIAGIKVEVEMFGTVPAGATNRENSIVLINGSGTRIGTDHSTSATLATADGNTYVTYGGSSDNWGGVITYADINSASFGVAIQYASGSVNNTAGNYNFNVDHVRVTITYATGYAAVANGCFNDGATWGRVSPGTAGIDYPDATIAASIPGGKTVTVCAGTTANCFALILNSDLSANQTATLTLAASTSTLNIAADILMLSSASPTTSFVSGQLNIGGGTITAQNRLIATGVRNPPNATSQSIVFGGGTLTVNGDVTMSSNNAAATTNLNMSAANSVFNIGGDLGLGVGASLTNGAGATGTINYKGTGAQIVRGAITYFNLTYSGGGLKTLEAATNVKGTFTMTSGDNDMAGQVLTLGSGATAGTKGTLVYTSGILYNGTFRRWFDTSVVGEATAAGTFPVGAPGLNRPMYVYWSTGPAVGGTLSVLHDYSTTGVTAGSPLFLDAGIGVTRRTNVFWTLSAANSFSIAVNNLNLRVDPQIIGAVGTNNGNTLDLRLTRAADVIGTHGVDAGTTSQPIVRRVSLPAFASGSSNNFYIGSVDAVNSSLPIQLIDFKAVASGSSVLVTWNTASELNNDYFTVQRSATGEGFANIAKVTGSGTTTQAHSYRFTDMNPIQGTSYYRLVQTDFDGNSTYSKIVAVNVTETVQPSVTVFPNPTSGDQISVALKGMGDVAELPIAIYDQLGRIHSTFVVKSEDITVPSEITIPMPNGLSPGIYFLKAGNSSTALVTKFIVR